MADITKRPFLNHLRSDPAIWVQHTSNGTVRRAGAGLAFWFRPTVAALSEVPLTDREQALLFQARTADFQTVSVQATVNYRVIDPALAITRVDFGINPDTGRWNATPLESLGGLLTELTQQTALEQLAGMSLTEALANGIAPVRDRVADALADDDRLGERGLTVTDVRVVAISAEPELERALQTDTRERLQQEADRATFERRALAVERERAIADNELQNKIALARREEELVDQRSRNFKKEAEGKAEAGGIRATAEAEQRRITARATAESNRLIGLAEAEAAAALLAANRELDQQALLAVALRELAVNLPAVANLTITPDLVTSALSRLTAEPPLAGPEEQG